MIHFGSLHIIMSVIIQCVHNVADGVFQITNMNLNLKKIFQNYLKIQNNFQFPISLGHSKAVVLAKTIVTTVKNIFS